jgi:hypothetical protein
VDHPQPDLSTLEKTDEEIRRAIRYLDPDPPRNASDAKRLLAIAVACDVWICLIFAVCKWLERSLELHGRYGR